MNAEDIRKSITPLGSIEPKLDNALDFLAMNSPETAVWETPGEAVPSK